MKVNFSKARKMTIQDVPGLDPITVFLEDFAPGQGQITIVCWGEAWTHYWGAMGEKNDLMKFVSKCDNGYLMLKFMDRQDLSEFDLEGTQKFAKQQILEERRQGYIGKRQARIKWNLINECDNQQSEDWHGVFGENYWENFQTRPTHNAVWLDKILTVVKDVFKQTIEEQEAVTKV